MRISIRFSLMVGMTILIGFLIGQAWMAISVLRDVHAMTEEIAEDWIPSVRLLGEINLQATRYRLRAARHVMISDERTSAEIDRQLNGAIDEIEKDFSKFEALISNERERRGWESFKADWRTYVDLQDDAVAKSRRGDKVGASRGIEESRDLFLGAVAKLTRETEAIDELITAAHGKAEATYGRSLQAIVCLAVVAVLFGLYVWRFVITDAAKLLNGLNVAMKSVAGGDLASPIPACGRHDEIGDMARTLVVLRDNLAETEQLRAMQNTLDEANMRMMNEIQESLADQAAYLDAEVALKTNELAAREREVVWRLSRATERRDNETGDHIARMARIAGIIAEELGLSEEDCNLIEIAAQMHDIGKVGIPDEILFKPGAFTPEERRIMETHSLIGWDILKGSQSRLIQTAADVAVSHHERWDGKGYPHQLAGEDIPLSGRITALADVFDALMSRRPYKVAWSLEDARAFIEKNSGQQFDPACVAAFFARWDEISAIAGTAASDFGMAADDAATNVAA